MFHSSIRHSAIRILLLAGILQSLALACDLKSPVEPDTTRGCALQVPDHVMYSVVPSELSATAPSWTRQASVIGSCTESVQTRSYAAK
jgi:hypothetical protein